MRLDPQLAQWLHANTPLLCVAFVVACAIFGATRSKRDG
jgi:hypothetical protein